MGCCLGRVIKKQLRLQNYIYYDEKRNQCVFSECRNIKPSSLNINVKQTKCNWQVGFFDADGDICFDKVVLNYCASFSTVVKNYWWNGKKGNRKKEGYYSLIESVRELQIYNEQNVNDLLNYVQGRYEVGEHWQIHELDRNMELRIYSRLEETTVEQLQKYFDNIQCNCIIVDLKTVNNITCNCDWYKFKNCKGVVPQKLDVNAKLIDKQSLILFEDADDEVHISKITINERGCFAAIVRNWWQNNNEKRSGYYSLVQYVETLTIRNNPEALKNFADYVIMNLDRKQRQVSKDIKIVIEGPGDAFLPILRISNYFNQVTVDGKQPENYLATWELWDDPDYKAFRTCFGMYGLLVEPRQYGVEVQKELELVDCVYNIRKSVDSIDSLIVRQKLDINQFLCFHDIDKAVLVDKIIIDGAGDLRSVLQNAYYNNGQSGCFSLLKTTKELEIRYNQQAVKDLAQYVDGDYALHPKWGIQALNKDMEIKMYYDRYHNFYRYKHAFSLNIAIRLRNYFKNVSIDCIQTLLETENVIDQQCEKKYIFSNCRDANPQKLVVNAKLAGRKYLILFNDADDEVCIPEITIGERGSFDAIARNKWWNCKNGIEEKFGYYCLASYVKTLTIQNNPKAVRDLDRYIFGNYRTKRNIWKVQKPCKNIRVRINGVSGLDEQINRLKEYFGYVVIDGRKALGNQCCEILININLNYSKSQQQNTANADRRGAIAQADAEIAETRRRIERARARLGRRCVRFQEYLALAE